MKVRQASAFAFLFGVDRRVWSSGRKSTRNADLATTNCWRDLRLAASYDGSSPTSNGLVYDLPSTSLLNGTGVTALSSIQAGTFKAAAAEGRATTTSTSFKTRLVVGTKRGDVAILNVSMSADSSESAPSIQSIDILETMAKPAPVYCLSVNKEATSIFVGRGDRFVSAWSRSRSDHSLQRETTDDDCSWGVNRKRGRQRLGPHTGWVKDIALTAMSTHTDSRRINGMFTIGCNRIETWLQTSPESNDNDALENTINVTSTGEPWTHAGSIIVESASQSDGACTLSSDLLCLATCRVVLNSTDKGDASPFSILAAGGVDGRLHFFDGNIRGPRRPFAGHEKDSRASPALLVVAAHDGRINALEFNEQTRLLASASHDGTVRSWSLSVESDSTTNDPPKLKVQQVASLALEQESRATALATWTAQSTSTSSSSTANVSTLHVAAGTQNGLVYALCLQVSSSAASGRLVQFTERQRWQLGSSSDNDARTSPSRPPIIHALCPLLHDDLPGAALFVGHSHGLSLVRH